MITLSIDFNDLNFSKYKILIDDSKDTMYDIYCPNLPESLKTEVHGNLIVGYRQEFWHNEKLYKFLEMFDTLDTDKITDYIKLHFYDEIVQKLISEAVK